MVPNREHVLELVRDLNWSGGELARRMGVSRTEANRLLNGTRVGGKKVIGGLIKAFPNEPLEQLFIFPQVEPNVNKKAKNIDNALRAKGGENNGER